MTLWSHWWLVIVLLQPVMQNGEKKYPAVQLEEFHDYETCAKEAKRVFTEMRAAYHGDTTYTIQCMNMTEKQA